MKVVFLHPDFGIGGAERLALDSALALQQKGHDVHIVTNQYSEQHCFTELKGFKSQEKLEVVGQQIPRSIFGKCNALFAYLRLCIAAIYICLYHRDADLVFCDQISAPLPIMRAFSRASLLFYCHFPDQCLCTDRNTIWKRLYRLLIDTIEAWTMDWADEILVNSKFTEEKVRQIFPGLADRPLTILYPSINCAFFDDQMERLSEDDQNPEMVNIIKELSPELFNVWRNKENVKFLSFNRFERKKDVALAIHAFAKFYNTMNSSVSSMVAMGMDYTLTLIIAGGFDPLNGENIAHFGELVELADTLGVKERVKFVKSPSDTAKIWLMSNANMILYTPEGEHFGIVPIEAMYLSVPVLAVSSGGPKETIKHEKTGFLEPAEPERWANAMEAVIDDPEYVQNMGKAAHEHVVENFSFDTFAEKLNEIAFNLLLSKGKQNKTESINGNASTVGMNMTAEETANVGVKED